MSPSIAVTTFVHDGRAVTDMLTTTLAPVYAAADSGSTLGEFSIAGNDAAWATGPGVVCDVDGHRRTRPAA